MNSLVAESLVCREADAPIAFIHEPLAPIIVRVGEISVSEFLGHVNALAAKLPQSGFALNLCRNRYLFMVAFCAVIKNGQTNLLPPNKNLATQQALCDRYDRSFIIHDGAEVAPGLKQVDLRDLNLSGASQENCSIEPEALAAITFTSGSTGDSQPVEKTWRIFVESTEINRRYMVPQGADTVNLVATVPGQHMWGLETSVLLALRANVCVSDVRPLFPADIQAALSQIGAPRVLVSTPVHLRAITMSGLAFPPVESTLCATAPLNRALAEETEQTFQGRVQEIYGCSEVGSMAFRAAANSDIWTIFDGIEYQANKDGVYAQAEHLPEEFLLQDNMVFENDRQFRLLGRSSDMIEIAGKRGSLEEVNKILLSTPGVVDGVVFLPETDKALNRLAALFVSESSLDKKLISARFREILDPVFVPRPIYQVDTLPREENGKLGRKNLLAFYEQIRKEKQS